MTDHDVVNAVFEDVARCLNDTYEGDWSYRPNPDDWAPGGHVSDSRSGMTFYAGISQSKKGSYVVRAESPKDSRGETPYVTSRGTPSINVSAGKLPRKIAEDVARRLIPDWIPIYEKALEAVDRSNQHEDVTTRVASEIARVVGVSVKPGEKKVSFYRSPHPILNETIGGAEVHGDDVELTLRLSHEDAVALLRELTSR